MRCTVRCGVGRSNIRARFFSMISLRLASLSTAETTERYRCTVDSLMSFPWCLRLRSAESIFSSAIGRSLLRRMPPIMGYTTSSIRRYAAMVLGAYFVCRFSQRDANSSKVISPSSA